jgi:Bacteriocin-protection, YdeI or OmpD-Associated
VGDQLLVAREGPLHGGDQQPVELGALHVLAHAVVAVAQVPVAELGETPDAEPDARANWDGFQGSTKRAILEWIIAAKRPPTRASRSLRPPGWLPRASGPISGAKQAAPSLNFPIRLQGNGDGAAQHQRTVSMAAHPQTGLLRCARMHAQPRRAGQAFLALGEAADNALCQLMSDKSA